MVGLGFEILNMPLTELDRGCKIISLFGLILAIETSF
jgi:hypothetical protein